MCVGIGAIVGMISSAVSAVGAMQQANAQAEAADYNAQVQRNNEIVAQRMAEDSRQRGIVAEQDARVQKQLLLSKQKTAIASRNFEAGSGTALDMMGDAAMFEELDALTIRHNYAREALSYETQAMNFNAEANLSDMEARNARSAGGIAAFGSILGGFGKAFGSIA
jgi:hypothetical protein